jgi:hypothetical protein
MRPRLLSVLQVLIPFLFPFLVGLYVHRQGFNLLDDGLWLLGTRIVVDGGTLYRDIFSIYGPARYFLLAPFFLILGKSALTLAIFKAMVDGTAALFGFWYSRKLGAGCWAWLVPLGVVALGPVYPRYLAAAVFAAMVGETLARPADRPRALFLGAAWGGLCLFGLDMAGYGAVILVGGWLLSRIFTRGSGQRPILAVVGLATGLGAVLTIATLTCRALGILEPAFWDTVVYPVTRFSDAMGVSWYESFLRDPLMRDPFAGHFTGEILTPGWPGHAWQRVFGFRAMFIMVWLIPVVFLVGLRRRGDVRLGPVLALALSGWATLLVRGDVAHLRLVWFGTLLLATVLVSRLTAGRPVRGVLVGLLLMLVLGPLLAEQVWLATHLNRPGLVRWERSTAQVYLETKQTETLEALCTELPWDGKSPLLVWPTYPGLQFVLGAPLATEQVTLLGGEVRDPAAVIADLEKTRPPVAIFGSARGIVSGVTNIQGLAPELWAHMRRHYDRGQEYLSEAEAYLVSTRRSATRSAAGSGRDPGAEIRLPGASMEITTGASGALGPGVTVAQSFRVLDFDLSAVEFLFRSPGPYPYPVSLVLTFYELGGPTGKRRLQQMPIQVALEKRTKKIMFSFPPLVGTRGHTLLMEITGSSEGTRPFSLLWNKATEKSPQYVDYYPQGQAYFNQQPVEADLYFVSY